MGMFPVIVGGVCGGATVLVWALRLRLVVSQMRRPTTQAAPASARRPSPMGRLDLCSAARSWTAMACLVPPD